MNDKGMISITGLQNKKVKVMISVSINFDEIRKKIE